MKEQIALKNLSDFANKSLLIVDDDNPFRERLARAMEKKGFEVLQAEGVKKGIDTVKAKKPGFAVVDLRLEDGNGLDVIKELSEMNSRFVTFIDPSPMEDKKYIKQLMKEMIPLKKMWGGLATVKIANDEELLDLAAESGCKGLLIGFETIGKLIFLILIIF